MASTDYLPSRQEPLRSWMENFDSLVSSDPPRFGLMIADAQSIHDRIQAFIDALALALGETTRNKGTVASKNQARAEMLQLVRPVAQRIRDNMGVAAEDKLLLGLTLPGGLPSPIAAPTTAPVLEIAEGSPLVHVLRYHDESTPTSRARADGTTGMQLFRAVSDTPPAGPQEGKFVAIVTRQPFRVDFESADARKTAYYWARWQTAKGLTGPWSEVSSRTVAA